MRSRRPGGRRSAPAPLWHAALQKQLSNAIDFLPGSWLAEFCIGGLNTHAVHHVWPHLPRGAHGWAWRKLRELEPEHYRACGVLATVRFLFAHRNPAPKRELPTPASYYASQPAAPSAGAEIVSIGSLAPRDRPG